MSTASKKDIAIIGMSGRFPLSKNLNELWDNLSKEKELTHFYSEEELATLGIPREISSNPKYIAMDSKIDKGDCFDYSFFGYTLAEARAMDPQTRIFHEQVWSALEDAGYNPFSYEGKIGLYAAASDNINWRVHNHFKPEPEVNSYYQRLASDKNFMTLLLSYKLNLSGPSIVLDSACSSSLVAVHQACRALMLQECSMALAGGIRVASIVDKGYFHEEGMIYSEDGHCRVFDKEASGTVNGEGVGVVVLKRLSDALRDKDNIYAVIKSTVVNNDGNSKIGFTAPSVSGQVDCIRTALKLAGAETTSIQFVEAHGTGTKMGDPIEIQALNTVFKENRGLETCAIGSIKSNIGHLDSAAGIAGLIKSALALKYKKLPASINFKNANPEIDFSGGPFFVNTKLRELKPINNFPIRGAVSAFGVGGVNAHAILEEAPKTNKYTEYENPQLILLSATSEASLKRNVENISDFLKQTDISLGDMCYTLQIGRRHLESRASFSFQGKDDLLEKLASVQTNGRTPSVKNKVVFMFSGQGTQYTGMGLDLYKSQPVFRDLINDGCKILWELTQVDYFNVIYPTDSNEEMINNTVYAQPLIFILEYALANTLMSLGIIPDYMIGHSLGEYTASCISGLISFEDTLKLLVFRANLFNKVERGAMLSVMLNRSEIEKYLNDDINLAAVNSPSQVVVSSTREELVGLQTRLNEASIPSLFLNTSHAFHSKFIDPVKNLLYSAIDDVTFKEIKIPYISNIHGDFMTTERASSGDYWVRHMRDTVNFEGGIQTLLSLNKPQFFIEIGVGNSLSSILKTYPGLKQAALSLIPPAATRSAGEKIFLNGIGKLWQLGVPINWTRFNKDRDLKRISLPTYSFEETTMPLEVNPIKDHFTQKTCIKTTRMELNDWFYKCFWKQSYWLPQHTPPPKTILMFCDDDVLSNLIIDWYAERDSYSTVLRVKRGKAFTRMNELIYSIDTKNANDYINLFTTINNDEMSPTHIIHTWSLDSSVESSHFELDSHHSAGYQSLINIAKSFTEIFPSEELRISVIGNNWYNLTGAEDVKPTKVLIIGALKAIPLEFIHIKCKGVGVENMLFDKNHALFKELEYRCDDLEVLLSKSCRFLKSFEKINLDDVQLISKFKTRGTYLITGSNGGMGGKIAMDLAENYKAKLILINRNLADVKQTEKLEGLGAELFILSADVSNAKAIEIGLKEAQNRFGKIDGVFHAAGSGDFSGVILRRKFADDEKVFRPKVYGTSVLLEALKSVDLDFFINCSSQAALIPPFGEVAYVASSIFLDSCSEANLHSFPVISLQWTALQEIGMAADALRHLDKEKQSSLLGHGIKPQELLAIIERALYINLPVQIISPHNFFDILADYRRLLIDNDQFSNNEESVMSRPLFDYPYCSPTSTLETELVSLVEQFISIKPVGIDDVFSDLGIDSLKSMVLLNQIRRKFYIEISLKHFFENNSVRLLAGFITYDLKTEKTKKKNKIII